MPKEAPVYRHFFGGNDSYASQREVGTWEELFCRKYGDVTRYVLDGSELDASAQLSFLSHHAGAVNLFDNASLLFLKRLCQKAAPTSSERSHLGKVMKVIATIPAGTTVLWWEPLGLSSTHPLLETMAAWQEEGLAKTHISALPDVSHVVRFAQSYLTRFKQSLAADAQTWLRARYNQMSVSDERGWWLHTVLESASLRCDAEEISAASLSVSAGLLVVEALPFPLTEALAARRFDEAYRLAAIMEGSEQSAYFALFGAIAWQLNRKPGRLSGQEIRHAHWLLGQVEITLKSGDVPAAWLLTHFIHALEAATNMLSPRTIWLATLPA